MTFQRICVIKSYTMSETEKLKQELEQARSQLYIFYELTQAMRTTLRLDEVTYIILTGLTAHHGLGFNRAVLFFLDNEKKVIRGFMGIGPMEYAEANTIWKAIENQKMDLYALIREYHRIKQEPVKPKFMEFIRSLRFAAEEASGIIYDSLYEVVPQHINIDTGSGKKFENDPLIESLKLREFIVAPLWSKENPLGLIVVDNCITKKPITEEIIKIFSLFINQAAAAIENSKIFENTLFKAHTDTLTSLWNYGYFQYKLDEELMKAKNQNYKLSVIMLDIDDFKKFNDTFGHQAGDKVLTTLASLLRDNSRKIDIAARYGGEEFALILPYATKREAQIIGERIRKSVETTQTHNTYITVSIGISSFDEDATAKNELIQKADLALYKAKREGKNKVVLT